MKILKKILKIKINIDKIKIIEIITITIIIKNNNIITIQNNKI